MASAFSGQDLTDMALAALGLSRAARAGLGCRLGLEAGRHRGRIATGVYKNAALRRFWAFWGVLGVVKVPSRQRQGMFGPVLVRWAMQNAQGFDRF